MHRTRRGGSIGNVIVIGQLLCLHGDGVGHVVHEVNACKVLRLTGKVSVITHEGIAGLARIAVDLVHLRAALEQELEHIVLRGDRRAVAPHEAVIDRNGIGLGAVLILHFLVALHDGRIVHESAVDVGDNRAVAVQQVIELVVRGGVVEARVIEVALQVGEGTDDQLAGRFCGTDAFVGSVRFGGRSRGAGIRVVRHALILRAGCHRERHSAREQQRQQFLQFHAIFFLSSFPDQAYKKRETPPCRITGMNALTGLFLSLAAPDKVLET